MGGQWYPLWIVQEVEVWPYEQMVYANSRISPRERDIQTPLGYRDTNGSPNLGQTTRSCNNQQKKKKKKKKKKNLQNCGLCCPDGPQNKTKRMWKYLDLAREFKKLWNMKVTIIPIVIDAFDTVTKGLVQGLEDLEITGRVETIQSTALMRSVKIMRIILETRRDLSLKLQWEIISSRWCEKL